MFKDKLEGIGMCHMLNNDLEIFSNQVRILYDKFLCQLMIFLYMVNNHRIEHRKCNSDFIKQKNHE